MKYLTDTAADTNAGASTAPWRIVLFRVLATLVGVAYLPGVLLMILPWAPSSVTSGLPNLSPLVWAWAKASHPDLQLWAFSFSACIDGAIAVILFSLAWNPLQKPLLPNFILLAYLVALCVNVPFVGPGIIIAYSALLIVVVAYPKLSLLLTTPWRGPISWPLLVLAAAIAAYFIPQVLSALQAQIRDADDLSRSYAWASIAEHLANLWLIAFFAAFRRPGAKLLALLLGFCLIYLGAAAICLPSNPGSWGRTGGAVAIVGGALYIGFIAYEWRNRMAPPAKSGKGKVSL